jgi:toxin YoeB
MMISFDKVAFEDFQSWASEDKKVFKKIGALIKDILRSPFQGIGKPRTTKTCALWLLVQANYR